MQVNMIRMSASPGSSICDGPVMLFIPYQTFRQHYTDSDCLDLPAGGQA